MLDFAKKVFGSTNSRRLSRMQRITGHINQLESEFKSLAREEFPQKTAELRDKLRRGAKLEQLLPQAFALVREAAVRALGQRPFDVQLLGGIVLHQGGIAEMKTGEGKTLVATMPVYLHALKGEGVHVVTVNEYLAKRDSDWMGRVYSLLGMTTGCITSGMEQADKKKAYEADITYGTNSEFGFDYLRDNMKTSLNDQLQRGLKYALIDEIDSILIDEARTPLVISGPDEDRSPLYVAVDALIPKLGETDFDVDEKARSVMLTEDGSEKLEAFLRDDGLMTEGGLYDGVNVSLMHLVQNSLRAHKLFKRDKDYIVKSGRVMIIDDFTGRLMEGRRWSDGLHQAVEAKERVRIEPTNQTIASITYQNYFRLYSHLAGMTGTAMTEEAEFSQIYGLEVSTIPTNRPIRRDDLDDELYMKEADKDRAIVAQIFDCYKRDQPVLVGTVSIEKSEHLSALLKNRNYIKSLIALWREEAPVDDKNNGKKPRKRDKNDHEAFLGELADFADSCLKANRDDIVPHRVLNARFHEQEAHIIADAGKPAAVTIATNMAGRGTDIQLGGSVEKQLLSEITGNDRRADIEEKREKIEAQVEEAKQKVLNAGGLFVLGTERHESRRIDNQLRGRSGRQGDPGATKFFLSLEDDLMRIFGGGMGSMLQKLGIRENESIEHPWFSKAIETAQKKVEQQNFEARKNILKYDDVINDQRRNIYEQRHEFLSAATLSDIVIEMRHDIAGEIVNMFAPEKSLKEAWDIEGLNEEIKQVLGLDPVDPYILEDEETDRVFLSRHILRQADKKIEKLFAPLDDTQRINLERQIVLQVLDRNWREHLLHLDHLRLIVGLRGYGQRDPLNEFKNEAFTLFTQLLKSLKRDVTRIMMHMRIVEEDAQSPETPPIPAAPLSPSGKAAAQADTLTPAPDAAPAPVSRNALCPCGSGLKYKHCCGKL